MAPPICCTAAALSPRSRAAIAPISAARIAASVGAIWLPSTVCSASRRVITFSIAAGISGSCLSAMLTLGYKHSPYLQPTQGRCPTLFVIIGHDAPDAKDKRPQQRPAHLAHLEPLSQQG